MGTVIEPSAPVVNGEPETAAVQEEFVYRPIFQPLTFLPVFVVLISFTPPLIRLLLKDTDAVLPAVMVTFWGLVLVQVYWLLMLEFVCPSSFT